MATMAAALARLLAAQGHQIQDGVVAIHEAVAGRVFDALGPLGAPSRAVHDAVTAGVHGAIRRSLGRVGVLGGTMAGRVSDEVLMASPRGRTLVGIVLGLIGDTVHTDEPRLVWPTVLLDDGDTVATVGGPPSAVTSADEVVVLLHGLCETELAWSVGSHPQRPPLPDLLARPGREVLLARMNSGLRPAQLGLELASLLDQRAGTARVVLVGHSMGGLVARAALRHGTTAGHGWVQRCDTLVTLGTPHLGAPLERAVDVLVRVGGLAPEVDAITRWFDQRSAGIRDLRHGADDDHDEPGRPITAAPLPSHVRLHTVGAQLPGARGVLFGDGLVRPVSAHARGARRPLHARRGEPLDVAGSHFDMLCAPAVTAHVTGIVDQVTSGSPALQ